MNSYYSQNNQISGGTITSTGYVPLYLTSSSDYDTISNDTFVSQYGNNYLVYLDGGSSGNTFYWDNFTHTTSYYVLDYNGSNQYYAPVGAGGAEEGNIWYNVMTAAVQINGTTPSLGFPSLYIGSGGPGYPYDYTTSDYKAYQVNDIAPLTPYNNGTFPQPPCECGRFTVPAELRLQPHLRPGGRRHLLHGAGAERHNRLPGHDIRNQLIGQLRRVH